MTLDPSNVPEGATGPIASVKLPAAIHLAMLFDVVRDMAGSPHQIIIRAHRNTSNLVPQRMKWKAICFPARNVGVKQRSSAR
ncbi:hypothetical protein ZHAS_00009011 [Anopheles sinensis]|uniref:Uncharacterized protein n=1 Tax=Anopheles sinensis TaxID=74873 RepID=A0A084VTY2_ANOSI|nr:hypothetical protein ZHAS_00009011 [Anopheles sinensis]